MYSWLDDSLSQDAVAVCASRRLARELRTVHNDMQKTAGLQAWPTPDIQYIGDWLNRLMDGPGCSELPLRIDSRASALLWERCAAGQLTAAVPGLSGIVREFRQTWMRLQEWRVPAGQLSQQAAGPEQRQFAAAARRYSELLESRYWVDDAGVIGTVADAIRSARFDVPRKAVFIGFDRISPAVGHLIGELEAAGSAVSHPPPGDPGTICITVQDDPQAELRAAGAWARERLSSDPEAKIAVVCPDLPGNAVPAARLVREGFAPGWQYGSTAHLHAVDVSYGQPLAEYPAIAAALQLLRWIRRGLSSREVGVLLRSRSIIGGTMGGRCRLESRLRRFPDREWRAAELLRLFAGATPDSDADLWCNRMRTIAEAQVRGTPSPAIWAERFDTLLTEAGWPGSNPQDSGEFQLLNRWRELLNEFAGLDRVAPEMSFDDALARIAGFANETVFQPESANGVLPVLGMLEAAGMEFDAIWIAGFTASRWPAAGNPLAYASRQLQKEFAMPDATPADSLAFSRRVLQRLVCSADDVVLSWATSEEGAETQLSPLADDLTSVDVTGNADPGWHAKSLIGDERVELSASDTVPLVAAGEQVRGGAYTVQRQAGNPFSAFAYGRLGVSDLKAIQPGLSASIRGDIVHSALGQLYSDAPSRTEIAGWSDTGVASRIERAVDFALKRNVWPVNPILGRMVKLERRRLLKMLNAFVEQERRRVDFQVALIEERLTYDKFGVSLDLRVDRVDRATDGALLVIDYKTGVEKSLLNRHGDLNDLQLMVYALAMQQDIGGLMLVNLDSRKMSYKATAAGDDWPATFAAWSATTEAAIKGIAAGDARVNVALNTDQGRAVNVLCRFEELRRGR